jgi:hypothetical protein
MVLREASAPELQEETYSVDSQKPLEAFEPISYRAVLLNTLLHATVYVFYTIC